MPRSIAFLTAWEKGPVRLFLGDCLSLGKVRADAIITDPPYGMDNCTDSTRFSGGNHARGDGVDNWRPILGDKEPFDPSPWLKFPTVLLWGANHFAQRLPVGTTLVWIKRADNLFGSFLSDAEIGWMNKGHGVYCFRKQFPPPLRAQEAIVNGRCCVHPNQRPIELLKWAMRRAGIPAGATVFDPYMGSGTTGVACLQMGLRFIGAEIEPVYFDTAKARIQLQMASMTPVAPLPVEKFDA